MHQVTNAVMAILMKEANRERKFNLMICVLKELVHLFFAFDHQNYTKWMPVYIQDLENLPQTTKQEFQSGRFVINRSSHLFSSIPIDHAHEQMNKKMKGVGGVIGMTENDQLLE